MKIEDAILLWGLFIIQLIPSESAPMNGVLFKAGAFQNYAHGISGEVFIKDEKTLVIKGFTYDGAGPDTFFWAGTSQIPSSQGTILPYPFEGEFYEMDDQSAPILSKRFNGEEIVLTLPDTLKTYDIKWLSVWERFFQVNFGDMFFPEGGPDFEGSGNEGDCLNNDDEDCQEPRDDNACGPSEFDCKGSYPPCIPNRWVNDGEEDCSDGSDEKDPTQYAKIPQWMKPTQSKIVGGDIAPEPIPWQVHVHFLPRPGYRCDGGTCTCGGTILNENTILSAAHCFYPLETAEYIQAGITEVRSSKGQKIDVEGVIFHPEYDESREVAQYDNDIAILKLKEPLTFNDDVLPARLPDATLNPEFKEEFAYISGWGTTSRGGPSSKDLKYVTVPILEINKCVNLNSIYTPTEITTNMICAGDLIDGGEDSCQGDSGGPMVIQYSDSDDTAIIYGIVSWGNGCAQQNGPGMYARVSNYNSWIQTNMNKEYKPTPKPDTNRPVPTESTNESSQNVPAAIEIYYDEIMSSLGTQARNLTLMNQVFDNDWRTIPNPLDAAKGINFGLGAGIRDFLAIIMPNLKYERKNTYVINETMVVVVSKISATIGDVPPKFSEFPMFPGIEPNKLKGKSFNSMALDIHILDNGKIQRTWHVEDWTLALDIMLETGRDVGSLDWPFIEKGETLKEVPQCIYNFYDKILSDSSGGGQNNKLLLETMHRNAIVRPRMSSLGVVGIGGLKLITSYFADVMPDIKYERQKMWIHEDKVVVLHKVSATNIKEPQRGFDEIPSFPGVDPKKLLGKKFETLGISIHRILDGKIKQTFFIDEWQLASAQMVSNRTAPDFDFDFLK